MHPSFLVSVLLLCASVPLRPCAAQASSPTPIPSRDERFGIRSAVLGEDREILVHLPPGAGPGERFDVVYVLDGTTLLPLAAGIGDYRLAMQRPPRVVFVGITNRSNVTRGRDLTSVPDSTKRWAPETGGADRFIQFLATEVIPAVEARYHVTRHRTLVGHSLSALSVLHTLGARPDLFERYIAVSPAIPWAREEIVAYLGARVPALTTPVGLYVSVANEQDGFPEGIDHLEALLRRSAPASLHWKVERWPQYDHIGVVPAAMHAGWLYFYPTGP